MRKWYSLYDKIYRIENLKEAYKRVRRNNGAPGIDGETVEDFGRNVDQKVRFLHVALKTKAYQPSPVRRVELKKPDGGIRKLGIPTVSDRVVQQAIVNIIEPIFDADFHPSSYGYRSNHSQQQAVAKAERFMNRYGLEHVVDMDLSKCFDTLDHELILEAVGEKISDGSVLRLIRSFLKSGVMETGRFQSTEIGSPQGGVISPLLSNIYLNKFDQRMKDKGIRIVRYADDILIFARDRMDSGNHLAFARQVLEGELKLKVNEKKTHLTSVYVGVEFLGFVIRRKALGVQAKRIKRFKDRIRRITKRNAGRPIEQVIKELNPVLRGWMNYYRIANIKMLVRDLMRWTRRRLRMIRMKQWKSYKKMHKEMRKLGIKGNGKKMDVARWKNSGTHIIHQIMPNRYFEELGLIDLCKYETGLLSNYY
jgi:RNA-directed DNA polymerase